MDKIAITRAGYERLSAELKDLKSVKRPQIIKAIAEARAHGDLSENAEYHAAKEEQGHNETRIKELESISALAEIIDVAATQSESIQFGATITVLDEDTEKTHEWQLVSTYEADANTGRLSISAPIARALVGRKKGDFVEVTTPGGTKNYEVLKVAYR